MDQHQHGTWIMLLSLYIEDLVIASDRQPGLHMGSREARVRTRIPLHGCASIVPTMFRAYLRFWVLQLFGWNAHVLHRYLIAIVAGWGSAQCEQEHLSETRLPATHPRRDALFVMIAQHPVRPRAPG